MTLRAQFDTFHVSTDGDIVYGGRLADRSKVEIRQAAADADVMIVLMAAVFEKTRPPSSRSGFDSHPVDTVTVETAPDGDLLLSLTSRDIRRSFRLDRRLAAELSGKVGAALKRPPLRAVT